ncbi:MAG: serine--tRNA ligase [candidate division Zixibacteria bacterium]|nr:serine--tRNA ligase [candidate division Zixibacteria bacterium]
MLDLKFIRDNVDLVKEGVARKYVDVDIDGILALDQKRRAIIAELEKLRSEKNRVSVGIARMKKQKEDASEAIASMKKVGQAIASHEKNLREVEADLQKLLLSVPNLPHADAPTGKDDNSNIELRSWGERPEFDFTPAPHWELGEKLGMFDLGRAARIAGSGFILYTGIGARLSRALINFMLDFHVSKHGYQEVSPPFLANRQTMTGTGQLPKMEEDMYQLSDETFFLIPTAEVPVTNIHAGEILKAEDLPRHYVAYTPCFRREAGAHGKDTRGLIRVHQFDKVEMVRIVEPEGSYDELEIITNHAEAILQALGLPYRVCELATGDLSFAAARCFDLEVWAAGVDKYLEVSSCSIYEDFQARRMNLRYRPAEGEKPIYPHTLNGSGLALPRTIIAIMENFQTAAGKIVVPEVLRPYLKGLEIIE